MKKVKTFSEFLSEAQISLKNPTTDGRDFTGILAKNRNVKESPKGSNKGVEVNKYLKSTGLGGGYPWCMAFVYYIFEELSKKLNISNPLPKTAGVMNHWEKAPSDLKIAIRDVRRDVNLLRPGQVFIMKRKGGKGYGHTGIVIDVDPKKETFTTMEGNTNDQKSGEGDRVGVNVRRISDSNLIGFIDYFKSTRTKEFEDSLITSAGGVTGRLKSPTSSTPLPNALSLPSDGVVGGDLASKLMDKIVKDRNKETPKASAVANTELGELDLTADSIIGVLVSRILDKSIKGNDNSVGKSEIEKILSELK